MYRCTRGTLVSQRTEPVIAATIWFCKSQINYITVLEQHGPWDSSRRLTLFISVYLYQVTKADSRHRTRTTSKLLSVPVGCSRNVAGCQLAYFLDNLLASQPTCSPDSYHKSGSGVNNCHLWYVASSPGSGFRLLDSSKDTWIQYTHSSKYLPI